jgi:hypothetical protein
VKVRKLRQAMIKLGEQQAVDNEAMMNVARPLLWKSFSVNQLRKSYC